MAKGLIPPGSIPGWPSPPDGIFIAVQNALQAAGFSKFISLEVGGYLVSDIPTAQTTLDTYVGSNTELQWNKDQLQEQLDTKLNNDFNLIAFIRAGTISTLTGTNVANFLASSTNNYRSLRNQIAAATTLAQLQAININAGWPSNP